MKKDKEPHWLYRSDYPNEPDSDKCCMTAFIGYLIAIVVCGVITMCMSCSRAIVDEVPVYIHDTLKSYTFVADTLIVDRHDSVWRNVYVNGDTVYIEQGRESTENKFAHNVKHDTIYIKKEVPVPVTKYKTIEVVKPLSWWQQITQSIGILFLIALAFTILYKIQRRYGWLSRMLSAIKALIRH